MINLDDYYYHYFGYAVCLYMFVFYFAKSTIIYPEGRDKGQIIAHILFVKTPVFMVYPSYAEMMSYCYGFMAADIPWLNSYFSAHLSEIRDSSPDPYKLYYISLSIASTYLMALVVLIILALVIGIIYLVCESRRDLMNNMA